MSTTNADRAITLALVAFVASCKSGDASTPKSMALQDEERRPIATWQTVGVVKDDQINRIYVVNSRSGLVCEHEYLDSAAEPGKRFSLVSCSLPDTFYR